MKIQQGGREYGLFGRKYEHGKEQTEIDKIYAGWNLCPSMVGLSYLVLARSGE